MYRLQFPEVSPTGSLVVRLDSPVELLVVGFLLGFLVLATQTELLICKDVRRRSVTVSIGGIVDFRMKRGARRGGRGGV
jgi:hypothetical protein